MRRPLIGLTGSRFSGRDIARNLDVLGDSPVDVFYADYSRALLAAGALAVFLPLDLDPTLAVEELDGLVLTGGDDIDPARYGAEVGEHTHPPEPTRDQHEFDLLSAALESSLPTLGVCRGLQLVNVHAGGTLRQHVPEHALVDEPGRTTQHTLTIEAESRLGAIYGPEHRVNSLHHQSVDRVGADLRVTARSEDHGVEGLEHAHLPIVAVQWHPEMLDTAGTDPLFGWLVDEATRRA